MLRLFRETVFTRPGLREPFYGFVRSREQRQRPRRIQTLAD